MSVCLLRRSHRPYDDPMSTFRTTFLQYITELRIKLNTAFSSLPEDQLPKRSQSGTDRDDKWIEYTLRNSAASSSPQFAVQHPHIVHLPFIIHPTMTDLRHSSNPVKHYDDPTALAPVLSKNKEQVVYHPMVGSELRTEEEHELGRFRHNRSVVSRLPHARQMWEAVLRD